nr:immunoglobulin heavy chain junction region [Mus musculus]
CARGELGSPSVWDYW